MKTASVWKHEFFMNFIDIKNADDNGYHCNRHQHSFPTSSVMVEALYIGVTFLNVVDGLYFQEEAGTAFLLLLH